MLGPLRVPLRSTLSERVPAQRAGRPCDHCILVTVSAPRSHHIQLEYRLATQSGSGLHNPLIALLAAVRDAGSVRGAADQLGFSYRHVWGELRRWETALGQPLVGWEKGRRARLTEMGEKLLFAERLAQARLAPQIAALQADIERAFALALDENAHVLTLHASHDDALPLLREHAAAQGLHLDVRFSGSVDALHALNTGRCSLAGFHVLEDAEAGSLTSRTYRPLLKPGVHKLIGFARRTQGLMVAPGNLLALGSLTHLATRGLRFVNRAEGTGTRVIVDELLQRQGLAAADLPGYLRTEPSHAAVAQAVASGSADAGIGLESAARACGLGFVPLVHERYYLVVLKSALDLPGARALRSVLARADWAERLAALPGYQAEQAGQVLTMTRCLPWWRFRQQKSRKISR